MRCRRPASFLHWVSFFHLQSDTSSCCSSEIWHSCFYSSPSASIWIFMWDWRTESIEKVCALLGCLGDMNLISTNPVEHIDGESSLLAELFPPKPLSVSSKDRESLSLWAIISCYLLFISLVLVARKDIVSDQRHRHSWFLSRVQNTGHAVQLANELSKYFPFSVKRGLKLDLLMMATILLAFIFTKYGTLQARKRLREKEARMWSLV